MKERTERRMKKEGIIEQKKKKRFFDKKTRALTMLALPALVLVFIFNYLPMGGLILAFKNFRYDKGLWGSDWVGWDNFKFFFTSQDAWRVTRNTLGYNIVFIILTIVCAVFVAILLNEVRKKALVKCYQTVLFLPYFMSWTVVAFMVFGFLNVDLGLINRMIVGFGGEPISWYADPKQWIWLMPLINLWKGLGYNTIVFYAALMAIDTTYYEAAAIDGASRVQMMFKITIPMLKPVIIVLTITMLGRVFYSDFGQFFMVTQNAGALYPTTDVIDTYVFRALRVSGDVGMASAVGFFQSFVGLVTVLLANYAVRRFDRENAMF